VTAADPARKLFAGRCDFLRAVSAPEQFPETSLPEAAFIGRSNVGKSSLVNALTGRKTLARASNTPGRTQQIVFFNLADRLMLVDLPGYGHAAAPKENISQWNGLIRHYLKTRSGLRLVGLLIDSRHGPMAHDIDMMRRLDSAAVSYQAILTKTDHIQPAEREPRRQQLAALLTRHPAARPDVLLTSARKGDGLEALRDLLAGFALPPA
jgi:GTP-binding protein